MDIANYGALPGIGAISETSERVVHWGPEGFFLPLSNQFIDSTAVDAGNTPTTTLRAGLLLGRQTSDGMLYQWNPDAVDGTEIVAGVLLRDLNMLDASGAAEDKMGLVLSAGRVKAADLFIEGTAFTSSTAEHLARRQMVASGRFLFDDEQVGRAGFLGAPINVINVTGNTTVTHAQNGAMFVKTAADGTFTLPTLEAGLVYEFLSASDHEIVVASAAGDDMIVGNDLSADSVTITTAGQQIGARIRVESIYVGTTLKWLVSLPNPPFGTGLTGGFAYSIAT